MIIYVFHDSFSVLSAYSVGIIENYESCIWNVQLYGQSEFQLITKATPEYLELLKEGRLLARDFDISYGQLNNPNADNVMIIESVKMNYDYDKGWILTVSGKGLKSALSHRIVYPQIAMTDNWLNIFTKIFDDNFIFPSDDSRKMQFQIDSSSFDAFYPEPITPLPTEDIQLFGENVANWVESVCKDNMIGWDMKLVNGFPTFYLFRGRILDGSDPTIQPAPFVKFSPENDNLLTVEYSHTVASNVALVGGEGEGTSKKTAWSGETSKDGYARNEIYIDGSGVSSNGEIITEATYLSMLKNYGQEQLGPMMKTGTFQGTVDPNVTYKLNQNYKLGDRVLIDTEMGITASAYIIEIIYSIDENGETIVPTFSEWEVNE